MTDNKRIHHLRVDATPGKLPLHFVGYGKHGQIYLVNRVVDVSRQCARQVLRRNLSVFLVLQPCLLQSEARQADKEQIRQHSDRQEPLDEYGARLGDA